MGRREFLRVATYAGGALVAGCGPKGVPGARVTLTQWYHQYGEKGTQDAVQRYAREYSRLQKDVAVQIVWVPGDYGTKLATALLTPGGPDIFEGQLTLPMVGAGQVATLDDLFTADVRADFNPKDLTANTVDGKLYALKVIDDLGLLYYRPSLLSKAGLKPPTTIDELIAVAKTLDSGDVKGLFIGNDGGVSALISLLPWSAGSDFLVDNKIVFNNPRSAASYTKLKELNDSGALLIGAPTDWWDPSAFTQGLAAMQWTGLWAYPAIKNALGDDVGAVPWPALDAQGVPTTFSGGWSQMVNAQNPHVAEAKKYVKWLWLDNRVIQEDWCLAYGFHVPPRLSLARTAAPLRAPIPALAVKTLNAYGKFTPPVWNSAMGTVLTDAVTNIVKQGRPAGPELAAAASKCERELSRSLE